MTLALLPLRLLQGLLAKHRRWCAACKPDVVVGLGGYITFPAGMMSVLLGKPLVLHEQNSVAGMANKVLAGVADRVFTAFPKVLRKARVGRQSAARRRSCGSRRPRERFAGRSGPLQVLVVGGSLGAKALNDIVPQGAGADARRRSGRSVLHQSGAKQIDELRANYAAAGVRPSSRPSSTTRPQAYRRGRPGRLPRRRQHRDRDRRRRRRRAVRAFPVRGGRPPDHQCPFLVDARRRLAGAADAS